MFIPALFTITQSVQPGNNPNNYHRLNNFLIVYLLQWNTTQKCKGINSDTGNNVDEPQKHLCWVRETRPKYYILYNLIIWNSRKYKQNYSDRKQVHGYLGRDMGEDMDY